MNVEPSRFFSPRKYLRVSAPPGGAASNIFGTQDETNTPRKIKDNQKSSIFNADQFDNVKNPAGSDDQDERNVVSPRYQENTKQRLFGAEKDVASSPRRINDTWRSNVMFSPSVDSLSDELRRTPRRSPSGGINPITGEMVASQKQQNGSPVVNGNANIIDEEISPMANCKINGDNKPDSENGKSEAQYAQEQSLSNGVGGQMNGVF